MITYEQATATHRPFEHLDDVAFTHHMFWYKDEVIVRGRPKGALLLAQRTGPALELPHDNFVLPVTVKGYDGRVSVYRAYITSDATWQPPGRMPSSVYPASDWSTPDMWALERAIWGGVSHREGDSGAERHFAQMPDDRTGHAYDALAYGADHKLRSRRGTL